MLLHGGRRSARPVLPPICLAAPLPLASSRSLILLPLPHPLHRLLSSWVQHARRHGVPPHKVVPWVRRKLGAAVIVVRFRGDGTLGCRWVGLACLEGGAGGVAVSGAQLDGC